ncbi:hypothetical protein EJB05_12450, partial [Eragrostis curvula]
MASYSPPTPPLHPRGASPLLPPPPPPAPPLHEDHDTTLTLSLPPQQPPPLAWAFPSPPPHAPARRPRPPSALAPLRASTAAAAEDTPPYPCTLCGGRPFPSKKALYGHMRCHPERPHRGMTPRPVATPAPAPAQFLGHDAGGAPTLLEQANEYTEEDHEAAESLLILAARPRIKKRKRSLLLGSPSWKETGGASASSPAVATSSSFKRNDHKCGFCHMGFPSGQALGGHKRCHMEKATGSAEAVVPVTSSSRIVLAAPEEAMTAATIALDLNLPPPGTPVPQKNGQGGSKNAMLDLKLGY